jgi:hypothetical protein
MPATLRNAARFRLQREIDCGGVLEMSSLIAFEYKNRISVRVKYLSICGKIVDLK